MHFPVPGAASATDAPAGSAAIPCCCAAVATCGLLVPQSNEAPPQPPARPEQATFDITVMDPVKQGEGVGVRSPPPRPLPRVPLLEAAPLPGCTPNPKGTCSGVCARWREMLKEHAACVCIAR